MKEFWILKVIATTSIVNLKKKTLISIFTIQYIFSNDEKEFVEQYLKCR